MNPTIPDIGLGHDQSLPGLDDFTPTPQQLPRGGTEKMDREVGCENRLIRADQERGGSTGGVVGEGGYHPGVDVSVLLPETGDDVELGLQPVGARSDQGDSKVGDKRRIGQHLLDL